MNEIYNRRLQVYSRAWYFLFAINFKKKCTLIAAACLFIALEGLGQTNNYFGTSGVINGAVWSTNPAGPYTAALVTTGGAVLHFNNAGTATGATIPAVAGFSFGAAITWTGVGTIGGAGINLPIQVSSGIEQDFGTSQNFSTSATAAFTKNGNGSLAMTGDIYSGGFTLNAGIIIARSINTMGSSGSNSLTLNGGIIASNANRDFTNKYPGGISIGGDVQFGDVAGLANGAANMIFSNSISLGAAIRILTLGNSGTITLGGAISNTGTSGVSFTNNTNGTGILDITNTANTFTGPVNINGGQTRFAGDGSFGNFSNSIVIEGGQLLTNTNFNITHGVQLANNILNGINVAGSTLTIDAVISNKTINGNISKTGAGTLVLSNANTYTGTTTIAAGGGTLQLNRPGGNTLPGTNNVVVNGGTFRISSNQILNDLGLPGGILVLDDGVILTINGTLDFYTAGSITLGVGSKIEYGPSGRLRYSGGGTITAGNIEFPATVGPAIVNCNKTGGVHLPFNRVVTGSLELSSGTFTIDAGVLLDLDGASLISTGGILDATNTSNLTVRGTTGGTVTLPLTSNISLQTITIGGTRTLAMNGVNNIALSGLFTIGSGASFDTGGESQITQNTGGTISIEGKFITRDMDGFTGSNTSIPGIVPILNPGCTIEYGLATGNPQNVTTRGDYRNITFSGSGIKTLISAFNPAGTVYVTGNAIVDAANNSFGDINTNLSMDGGRLRLSGIGPKPDIDGAYSLSGNSVIEFYNSGTVGNETIKGKNGIGIGQDILYNQIEITGNKTGNSNSNIMLNNNGTFTVKSGGVFEINDNSIIAATATSGQSVSVENNGTFLCGNNKGFNGFPSAFTENSSIHSNITNIVLGTGTPGSTIEYTRAGDQPITDSNGIIYSNIILSGSGIKTAPAGTLTVKGNLTKTSSCTFEANNGLLLFNNTTVSQSISAAASPLFTFYDITNSNTTGLTISNNIAIKNTLTLSANSLTDLANSDITLMSTASTTARVATVPATASISYTGSGRFIVERYFPSDRSWRLITSPLSGNNTPGTIFSQWQNNGVYTPGIGAFVTGLNPTGTTGNGLDYSNFNNFSLKTFGNNSYINIGNTKVPLSNNTLSAANIGYFMFVRGDRNRSPDNTIFPNTNNTTLISRGKLQSGTQIFPGFNRISAGGSRLFTLVGNPYVSPVNFDNLTRTNLYKRFVVWDPKINTVGAFVYIDDPNNDGIYSIFPIGPGGQDLNIQSSQAFFVETDSALGPSEISFEETSKSTVNNRALFRPVRPVTEISSFISALYLVNPDRSTRFVDGNLAEFHDGFKDTVDLQDALKFSNVNETFGLSRYNHSIAMERRPVIKKADTLYFNLARMKQTNYQFRFEANKFDPLVSAILEDSFTGTSTPINVASHSTYHFTVTGNTASAAPSRFRIVFTPGGGGPLPVSFSKLDAVQRDNDVVVTWTVENERSVSRYEVEKSDDGVNFRTVNSTPAKGNSTSSLDYLWIDKNPFQGHNYYRIGSIGIDGKKEYSRIVKVKMEKNVTGFSIFPNPVSGNSIGIQFNEIKSGIYSFRLVNNQGQVVFSGQITHAGGSATMELPLKKELPAGTYQLELIDPVKNTTHFKMLKR